MRIRTARIAVLFGIVVGIILASLANDEIILLQAKTPEQRESAQFYIGIFSFSSAALLLISTLKIIKTTPNWITFIRAISGTATLINIGFLMLLPKIFSWFNA